MVAVSEVRKKIIVEGSSSGLDETRVKLDNLSKAQAGVGKSAEDMAGKSESASRRQASLAGSYDKIKQSLGGIEQMQQQLASGQDALNASFQSAAAANDNFARSHSAVLDALRMGAKAVVDHGISVAATSAKWAAGALLAAALVTILGGLYVAYKVVKTGIDLVTDAWALGGAQLEKYVEIAGKAASMDVSTDFFQRITKAAEDAKTPVDELTASFKRLNEATSEKLGGSDLQNRVDQHLKAGNFAGNTGVTDLSAANTTEEKYRAVISLIDQAMAKGQRFAALDIAGTALGTQVVENLKKDQDYLKNMLASADRIAANQLVSPEDVGRALDLKNRYENAVEILSQRWHPLQKLLTAAGVEMHAAWVSIVETIAKGVDWVTKLIDKVASFPLVEKVKDLLSIMNTGFKQPEGPVFVDPQAAAAKQLEDAYSRLGGGLKNKNAVAAAMAEVNAIQNKVFGDTSKKLGDDAKGMDYAKDALARAVDGIEKYILVTDAAAKSVGAGIAEQTKAKVIADLTAAAQRDGATDLTQYAAAWDKLGERAGQAAKGLALARIQSEIKFDQQTMFLSPQDVQIARQLKDVYDDVGKALSSNEAAALRLNGVLKPKNDNQAPAQSPATKPARAAA